MNSKSAAEAARHAFNEVLDVSYADFDAHVDHEWARNARYCPHDLEDELARRLDELG